MSLSCGCFLTILLLSISHAQADIYRCVDESGKINFKDHPCQTGSQNKLRDRVKLKQVNILERNEQVDKYQQGVRLQNADLVSDIVEDNTELNTKKKLL